MLIIEDKESATKLSDEERQGLNKLYAAINEHQIETVYCWELSRLSRKPQTLYTIKDRLSSKNINLIIKRENLQMIIDGKVNENFNVIFAIYIGMCVNEGIQRIERTVRSKKNLALNAHYNGGVRRYGYQINSSKDYELHNEESEIVRLIFELYSTGKFGTEKLHKELNTRGININERLIQNILKSKCYTGEVIPAQTFVWRGKEIHLYERRYPEIISIEQFEKCREVANLNNSNIDKSKNIYYGTAIQKIKDPPGNK